MAETLDLSAAQITSYRVRSILLDYNPPNASQIRIMFVSNDNTKLIEHNIADSVENSERATALIRQLNKANLTSNTLNERAIQLGIDDGVFAGTIGGTTD